MEKKEKYFKIKEEKKKAHPNPKNYLIFFFSQTMFAKFRMGFYFIVENFLNVIDVII